MIVHIAININMRCIEIRIPVLLSTVPSTININMRCIEIYCLQERFGNKKRLI